MDNFDYKKYLSEGRLLNESAPGYDNRKFGESLPTMEGVKAAYEAKKEDITDAVDWNFEENIEKIIDELKEYQKVNPQDDLQTAINHLESLPTLESVKAAYEAKNDIKEDKSEFERNTSGRINQFNKELDALVDEYHAELYLNDDIFAGIEAVKMAANDLVDPGNDDSYNSND